MNRPALIRTMSLVFLVAPIAVAPTRAVEVSEGIQWRDDIQRATQEVFREQRPMLLLFTMDGCGYCQLIKNTTLADRQVTARVNDHFVPMRIHGNEHRWLAQRLGVRVYPTMVIISPENRVVDRMEGYVKAQAFLPRLATAVQTPAQARTASSPVR